MILTDGQLAFARSIAEQAMTATLYITGPSSEKTDPNTGQVVTAPGPAKYATEAEPGIGLVQQIGQGTQVEQIVGGVVKTISTYAVKIPVTTTNLEPNDEVHIVTSDDPALPGRTLIVSEPVAGNGYAIQRRLVCTLDLN